MRIIQGIIGSFVFVGWIGLGTHFLDPSIVHNLGWDTLIRFWIVFSLLIGVPIGVVLQCCTANE